MNLRSSAVVFQVSDVEATMRWYENHLGFKNEGAFPATGPPFVFGILSRDNVEIMLQQVPDPEALDTYRRRACDSFLTGQSGIAVTNGTRWRTR